MQVCSPIFQPLMDALNEYALLPHAQRESVDQIKHLLAFNSRCFERDCFEPGHLTASALLLNPTGDKVLLTLHHKLKKWLQLGGHAEGETDLREVALREVREESGIEDVFLLEDAIFDVDVHLIPARPQQGDPAHYHFDVRYLVRAAHENFACSDESDALAWVSLKDVRAGFGQFDTSMLRLMRLWEARGLSRNSF